MNTNLLSKSNFAPLTRYYGGYIFDCDGTLAHSMPLHWRAWRSAFAKAGARFDFTVELFRSTAGMSVEKTIELLNDKFAEKVETGLAIVELERFYEEQIHTVEPVPDVAALAREMFARQAPMAVASGGKHHVVNKTLAAIGLCDLFDTIVTADDVVNGKPAPDMFLLAAEKMGVAPKDCVVFEDSPLGLEAARLAGMTGVHVRTDIA